MDLPICFTLNCTSMLLISSFENETRVTNLAVELELLVSVLRLESFESFCSFMLKWILLLHFLLTIFYEVLRDVRTHLSILYLHHILWLVLFILNSLLLFHSFSISLRQMFMTLFARLLSIFHRSWFTRKGWLCSIRREELSLTRIERREELLLLLFLRFFFWNGRVVYDINWLRLRIRQRLGHLGCLRPFFLSNYFHSVYRIDLIDAWEVVVVAVRALLFFTLILGALM